MRQIYLPELLGSDRQEIRVTGKDFHHIVRVLRLGVGDELSAVDAAGERCTARIARLGRDSLTIEACRLPQRADSTGMRVRLHLFQCLPKEQKMDIIVRQATESGVATIVPVRSARSERDPSAGRVDRWTRISIEAVQQSGRRERPEILACTDIEELAAPVLGAGANAAGRSVFFHEEPSGAEPLHRILATEIELVRILVGPEGGLSPDEVRLLRASGWRQAYLGPDVLRVETAATAAVGAVRILLLERDAWTPAPW